jgi:LPS export ABC transporter protein LptC
MSSPIDGTSSISHRAESALRRQNLAQYLRRGIVLLAIVGAGLLVVWPFLPTPPVAPDATMTRQPEMPEQPVSYAPHITGVDKNELPYEISASKGYQDSQTKNIVHLENVNGKFRRASGSDMLVESLSGRYKRDIKILHLEGSVVITEPRFEAKMEKAAIDVSKRTLTSESPVKVKMPDSEVTADSLLAESNGERLLFRGRVKAHFDR